MSSPPQLPGYARGRYHLAEATGDGRRWIVLHDKLTGAQLAESASLPVADGLGLGTMPGYDALVRTMIRFADARRPPTDPIGSAARAANTVNNLRALLTGPADVLVEPDHYEGVLQHVADALADLQALAHQGAEMCASYEDMADEVAEVGAARQWRSANWRMNNLGRMIESACTDARVAVRIVSAAAVYNFDCGDCRWGRCHWGGEAARRRAEAEGRTCACSRHEVSVALRTALPLDDDDQAADVEPAAPIAPPVSARSLEEIEIVIRTFAADHDLTRELTEALVRLANNDTAALPLIPRELARELADHLGLVSNRAVRRREHLLAEALLDRDGHEPEGGR